MALCGEGGPPRGHAHPTCEAAQQEGVAAAVGRSSVPIPDADLLRDTDSVCGDSGVPAPQTRDLSNVTFAKADASPTGGSGAAGWKAQSKSRQTLRWPQHRSGSHGAGEHCRLVFSALAGPA